MAETLETFAFLPYHSLTGIMEEKTQDKFKIFPGCIWSNQIFAVFSGV